MIVVLLGGYVVAGTYAAAVAESDGGADDQLEDANQHKDIKEDGDKGVILIRTLIQS